MKIHILSHSHKGLNDPMSILKHNIFLQSNMPRVDVLLFYEHKLRGLKLEHLGKRLMPWSTTWVLEVEPCYKSWLNPEWAEKGGVDILLASKYHGLVTSPRPIMNDRFVWIKMEGIEGGNLGIACI